MADTNRSLGLSRSRSSVSSASSSSSSSRSHAPPGPPKAGERRAKTPLRARKIINTMDKGLQKSKEEQSKSTEREEREAGLKEDVVPREGEGGIAETKGEEAQHIEGIIPLREVVDGRRRDEPSDQRPAKLLKTTSDGGRYTAFTKPKQAYLTYISSTSPNNSEEESDDIKATASTSVTSSSSSSTSLTDLTRKTSSVPRVPLFSSASKREIQSLTSRKALQDESNPITHSTLGAGTLHYNSSSTGHQQANRVGVSNASSPEGWWHTRMRKLKDQAASEEKQSDLFKGLSIYINGYAGTQIGNKELQRLLSLNGAEVHYLPNGRTTHIVSEMPLSAKKTQEMLQLKAGRVKKFVKVDWILDSIQTGKRRPEHPYAHPIPVQRGIAQMLNSHSSGKATSPGVASPFLPTTTTAKGILKDDGEKKVSTTTTTTTTTTSAPSLQDWREVARKNAALAAATSTERQKRCS